MSTETTEISPEVRAMIDRAVRACREQGYCHEFVSIAQEVFGVPEEELRDSDGRNCAGIDLDGYDEDGYDDEGYDKDGFSEYGYDRDGFDKDGYNRYGINKDGVDRNGNDQYRFDLNGYDREGYDHSGRRFRGQRAWYEAQAAKPDSEFRYDRNYNARPTVPSQG